MTAYLRFRNALTYLRVLKQHNNIIQLCMFLWLCKSVDLVAYVEVA